MSRLCRFFLILILAYAVSACSPIGSIGSDTADYIYAVPSRLAYNAGESLKPNSDLKVFASYGGAVKPVPLSGVEIGIAETPPPYFPSDLKAVPLGGYKLETAGTKFIVVEYIGMSASYSIVVSSSGSGIIIEWAE